jgi:hypothetical protein
MGRKNTAGTRQLAVEIDTGIRDRLDERKAEERRSLRSVVEQALAFYFDNAPVDGPPALAQPKRGRPKKAKGD